jgi:hypothetical protein
MNTQLCNEWRDRAKKAQLSFRADKKGDSVSHRVPTPVPTYLRLRVTARDAERLLGD